MPETLTFEDFNKIVPDRKNGVLTFDEFEKMQPPEFQKSEKRGLLGNVRYFLGEGVLKSIARTAELIPAGAERVLQVGLDNVREIAKRQLAEDGAVFGISDEKFRRRTPEQKRRIATNNKIVENMDKAMETSKRLQGEWIKATQTGIEAPSREFIESSGVPFTENFSFTKMIALGTQSIPMLGFAAAVTAATKSPVAGAAIIGTFEAAEEFAEAREAGLSIGEANFVFVANATVLSALETIPLTSFMKGGKLPVRMFRVGSQEGSEEVLQGVWRNSVAKLGYDETRVLTEGIAENFIGGFISGFTIGGFGPRDIALQDEINSARKKGVDVDKMTETIAEQVIDNADNITDSFLEKTIGSEKVEEKPAEEVPREILPEEGIEPGILEEDPLVKSAQAKLKKLTQIEILEASEAIKKTPEVIARLEALKEKNKLTPEEVETLNQQLQAEFFGTEKDILEEEVVIEEVAGEEALIQKAKEFDNPEEFIRAHFRGELGDVSFKLFSEMIESEGVGDKSKFLKDNNIEKFNDFREYTDKFEGVEKIVNEKANRIIEKNILSDVGTKFGIVQEVVYESSKGKIIFAYIVPDITGDATGEASIFSLRRLTAENIQKIFKNSESLRDLSEIDMVSAQAKFKKLLTEIFNKAHEIKKTREIEEISIPDFKNTEEALTFGFQNKDNPAIIEALKAKREAIQAEAQILKDKPKLTPEENQKLFELIQLAQFPREAMEAAEGKIKPEDLKRIKSKLGLAAQIEPDIQREGKLPPKTSKVKERVREVTGQRKVGPKDVSERQAFLASLRDRVKAAAEATKITRKEIANVQTDLIDLLEKSDFGAKDRAKFIRAVKNIQTQEQLKKNLPTLLKRIESFEKITRKEREKRLLRRDVLMTIRSRELKKAESLRKFFELPTLKNMSTDQLTSFNNELKKFQRGDEFLSLRKLQTVDNTDLTGIRTVREAKERLAKKINVPIESLDNIRVSPLDKFSFDTALARKNPFYEFLVDETNASLLDGEQRFLELERQFDILVTNARKSRKRSLAEKAIPSDLIVFKWLEAQTQEQLDKLSEKEREVLESKEDISREMTSEELELAGFIQEKFVEYRDYLIEHKTLERYQSNYITHIRRGFLEAWKEEGLLVSMKEVYKQYQEDEAVFKILEDDTDNILPLEKFFQFAMRRTGGLEPSKNVAKAFKVYTRTLFKKQSLDKIVPALDIYTYALSPKEITPRGLEMNRRLIKFVREWVNNKKGRKTSLGGILPQNGVVDIGLRMINGFITFIDLGLNIPVSLTVAVGEQVSTFVNLGSKKYTVGVARINTKKGKKILEDNEAFVGKSPWRDLANTADSIDDKFDKSLYFLFDAANTQANKIHLLGSLSNKEWSEGKIDPLRLAQLKREIGRFRNISGAKSIFGSTSLGSALTKYKTWALPIFNTIIDDLSILGQMTRRGEFSQTIKSREFNELFRATLTTTLMVLAAKVMIDDDDKSFIGKILKKAHRESLTILGAVDPTVLSSVRMLAFIEDLGIALKQIVLLEKYKTKPGLKGINRFRKTVVPRAIEQFKPEKKKRIKR